MPKPLAATITSDTLDRHLRGAPQPRPALVILWSLSCPERAGEVLLLQPGSPGRWCLIGRGPARNDDRDPRVLPVRQRPGVNISTGPLTDPGVSRRQLRVRAAGASGVEVRRVGRCELISGGRAVDEVKLRDGDIVELKSQLLLMCTTRRAVLPEAQVDADGFDFGRPDPWGMVGEGPAAWELRDRIAFAARRSGHILVTGPSGAGKEAVAHAIHGLSSRGRARLVARNAATLPEGLVDAELFGNLRNYPNPGMPERKGLIGAAHQTTLFLDEIGELPSASQAHLLRVLDSGEYHRLGESEARQADLRLIGATNRSPSELKEDFRARLALSVAVPGLPDRREDVPLIAYELLRRSAREDSDLARKFFPDADPEGYALMSPRLVHALVSWGYSTHVRELLAQLFRAMESSPGPLLACPPDLVPPPAPSRQTRDPGSVTRDELIESLQRNDNVLEATWRDLELSSRYVLRRLMRKHDVTTD